MFSVILVFIVGFIAGCGSVLDEHQTHRPLVVCTLTGLAMGQLTTGVAVGGTLELLALGWMNVGAAMAPDAALAGIISTILVCGAGLPVEESIGVAVPVAVAGQMLTIFVRTIAVFFQHKADDYAANADFKGIERMHFLALSLQGFRVAIPAAIVCAFSSAHGLQNFLNNIPPFISEGLRIAGGVIVVVGYAMVINMMKAKALMPFFFLGFVVAVFSSYNLIALGIIGLAAAVVYVQLSPRFAEGGGGGRVAKKRKLADNELEGL